MFKIIGQIAAAVAFVVTVAVLKPSPQVRSAVAASTPVAVAKTEATPPHGLSKEQNHAMGLTMPAEYVGIERAGAPASD